MDNVGIFDPGKPELYGVLAILFRNLATRGVCLNFPRSRAMFKDLNLLFVSLYNWFVIFRGFCLNMFQYV